MLFLYFYRIENKVFFLRFASCGEGLRFLDGGADGETEISSLMLTTVFVFGKYFKLFEGFIFFAFVGVDIVDNFSFVGFH